MKRTLALLSLLVVLSVGAVLAEKYAVTVTRKGQNLYHVVGTDTYIKTRFCYAYVYYEDAIVDTDDRVIYFLDSGDECDIEKII